MVQLKAYGKINLTLEVLGLRVDGYHEIRSIMQNIELHDNLTFENNSDGTIELTGNCKLLEYNEKNLIYKSAKALLDYNDKGMGVRIYLDKRIPLEAGLAGGSADAAATLIGLNNLWELNLSIDELISIGSQIGSDIPFCLVGKTALVEGRGEKVTSLKSPSKEKLLIVKPEFGASTKLIYSKYDELDKKNKLNNTDLMINEIINEGDYKRYLYNDLEKVTAKVYPEVKEILDIMHQECEYAIMSGSGPTCLAFGDEKAINLLYDIFKVKYKDVLITSLKT
ncbi:MAG: 4-(cytidine 5'-diphospho)-2-C-methyl-D-erythritol kinase [Firmicutes bacterium]|nr:4-(cytidine 5'-diphospho)-2-C-methyl-D-erythritol kinase [Bacillota bacterium]